MPSVPKHCQTCQARTGHEFRALHEWLDNDPELKTQRYDLTNVLSLSDEAAERFGPEARQEVLLHLLDDLKAKLLHALPDQSEAITSVLAQLGIKQGSRDMGRRISDQDVALLRNQGMNEEDLDHSIKVAEKAIEIARRTGVELDLDLVARGALFHDLGKILTHDIPHGRLGAELGLKLGLPAEVCAIMEKHIRGGLTAPEAVELRLPVKDYILNRLEERIIIYADRLVDIITDPGEMVSNGMEAEERFEEILRQYPRYGKNQATLERYLKYHNEIKVLMTA